MQLPQTVLDAVVLMKRLGCIDRWVGQFHIIQTIYIDKHMQIAQFDAMYARAEVTSIATFGNDAAFGLTGTSHPRFLNRKPSIMTVGVPLDEYD
jgi:hypothetical protein